MPDDGVGNYSLPLSYRVTNGDATDETQHNPPFEDLAEAMSNRLHRDGRTSMTGDLNANGNKITGLAAATNPNDAVRLAQLADGYEPVLDGAATKETPVDADAVVITDSEDSDATKRTTWTNVKAFLKTYLDTLYATLDVQDEATWEAGTETTESIVSPAKIKAAATVAAITAGGGAPDAVIEDQKSAGTHGGTFTWGGWRTRDLNTVVRDPETLLSLSSNEFTPTVDGWVEWSAPARQVSNHKTRLYNQTDATVTAVGSSEIVASGANTQGASVGGGPVVAGKSYRIQHYCYSTQNNDGFGAGMDVSGLVEVYTRVKFWRTA